jgi:secreted trypsin-like serine protease
MTNYVLAASPQRDTVRSMNNGRIVNGTDVPHGKYPFMVSNYETSKLYMNFIRFSK